MASIRISQLAEVTTVTNDDYFVVNDGDINTRKINYGNLTTGLINTTGGQTIAGALTVSGALTSGSLTVDTDLITTDTANDRVGINTTNPQQTLDVNGTVQIRGGSPLRLLESTNAHAVTLQAGSISASTAYTLPLQYPASNNQVLASTTTGGMSWVSSLVDPMAAVGDIIVRDSGNATSRLAIGTVGQVLTVSATGTVEWATGGGGSTPTLQQVTTAGPSTGDNVSVGYLFTVQGDSSQDGRIKLNCSQNSHGVTIQSPPHSSAATYTLVLPDDTGTAGQVLSTDGSGNLSWATAGGGGTPGGSDTQIQYNSSGSFAGSSSMTFDGTVATFDQLGVTTSVNTALIPDGNATRDLGTALNKWRDLYLDSASLHLGSATVSYDEVNGWLELDSVPVAAQPVQAKPTISGSNPDAVDQGALWSTTLTVDSDLVGVTWYFYDYTGTPGIFNRASTSGTVAGIENTPGTYTIKARAAWEYGMSDELELTVTVNAFTLNQDTMFGGLDGLQGRVDLNGDRANYIAVQGAFADNGSGYVWDIDGSVQANCANSIAFYEYTSDQLIGFRVDNSNVVEGVYLAQNVTALPTQGATMPSGYFNMLTDTNQKNAAIGSSVLGRKFPLVANYNFGAGSQHYLTLTPSGTEFDGFGSSSTDWSFGFRLVDDWVGNGYASQLMAPSDSSLYFVNAITGYGIGASPYESIFYGDSTLGPYNSSTNGATWDISTTGWLIGNAGDLVVVTYDGTGTDTYKVYVEGTLIFSSTSVDTYMPSGATTPTSLEFGNFSRANGVTGYPTDYDEIAGWYARLNYIFTSVGTAFDQTQVTELTTNKADLTASTNYGSIDTLGTFTPTGVTNTKGSVTYARGDFSF